MNCGDYVQTKTILNRYGCCPSDSTDMSQYVKFSDLSGITSTWSSYPAIQDVSFGCNRLLSVSGIYFCDGTYIGHGASFDISTTLHVDIFSPTLRMTATTVDASRSTVHVQELSGVSMRCSTMHCIDDLSSNIISTASITAPLVNGGIPYTTVYPPPYTVTVLPTQPHNGILYVDLSFGDDASANATGRYLYSYKTFAAALAAAVPGDTLYLLPGTYNLSAGIIVPNNVSIRGLNVQTTTITATPTVSTTLLTIGQNTRIEDITLTLTSATPGITLVALDFSGSSTTSKLRNAVVNVTSSDTSSNVIGVRSSGTTSLAYSPSDAMRGCTINVNSVGSTFVRGIYVTGANRFSARDINIYADGLGNNSIGCEMANASGVLYVRNSSVYGVKADISRPIGTLYVGATELVNSNANGYDFDTMLSPINVIYGTRGNLGAGTYYLLPGTYAESDILDPSNAFRMPNQACIHGMSVIVQKGITGAGGVFTLQKNGVDVSGFTVTLPTNFTAGTYDSNNVSASFAKGDRVAIKAVLASNWNGGQHPIVDLSIY